MVASLSLAAAMLCGTAAKAQNVPGTAYYGGNPSNIVLTVPVIATVGGRCGFATNGAPSGTYNIPGTIDATTWSNQFPFTLECTGPFRIAVVSTNGGLKTTPTSDPGYTDTAPYNVLVNVARSGGTTQGTCTAADLKATASTTCDLRGTASPTVGMSVPFPSYQLSGSYLQVSAPAYTATNPLLIAGSYTDTLTVTVSPSS